jgi:phospholipid/cholesterol/gamma-HCH transport system substrate-binding protein
MRRALRRNGRDVVALGVMAALAVFAVGYILAHQVSFQAPSWLPGGESDRYEVQAEFASAAAIVPGQGQPVTIAGVQVGDVKAVDVDHGRAVVTLSIERRHAPIYGDATILLRPRTPLQDMFLALDPGTPSAGAIRDGGLLPISQTQPDVKFDEILSSLDEDSRTYLRVLVSVAGGALGRRGAPADLRAALKQFKPIAHDTRRVTTALAQRRDNIARVVHRFGLIAQRLAGVDRDIANLVGTADRTFAATAGQDRRLAEALAELPATLRQTTTTLGSVDRLGARLGPTLRRLQPFATSLGPALRATAPFFSATAPVLRT